MGYSNQYLTSPKKAIFIVCLILILVLSSGSCFANPFTRETSSLEDKVKSAYILNFIRYTAWPAEVFHDPTSPLIICVLSADSFVEVMQKTVSTAKSVPRNLEIRQLKKPFDSSHCHVIFVAHPYTSKDFNLISSIKQKSVLSISDDESFFKSGGIISFVVYEKTIQFNVNLEAADLAGLKLSSRMLSLAKTVIKERKD